MKKFKLWTLREKPSMFQVKTENGVSSEGSALVKPTGAGEPAGSSEKDDQGRKIEG